MDYQFLLLPLLLSSSVFSVKSQCPSMEDILPCKCKAYNSEDIELKCQGINLNDLRSALSYFSKVKEFFSIDLSYLDLGTIPSNLFKGVSVNRITFHMCEVDFEDGESPLTGLEDSLQVLKIHYSLSQKNRPLNLKFGHLKELRTLELWNNEITELDDDMFADDMPNLFQLDIRDNQIEKIGEKTFSNLKNIKYFTLEGNKLGSLRRSMIPTSATQLLYLYLDSNDLTDLPEDLFTSMPSLQRVSLSKNMIKTVDRSTWEAILKQLNIISLQDNPIQCDSEMEWLFNKGKATTFFGTCAGPTEKKGLELWRFIFNGKQ